MSQPPIKDAMIHFEMDGAQYCFVMPAESFADAERRMRAIRLTGKVFGWPCYTVRANALTMPFVAAWSFLFCTYKNLFGKRT